MVVKKVIARAKENLDERRYKKIASKYDFNGYKRIYLVHIRKTGGTSLNKMFLSLSGEDSGYIYDQLSITPKHRMLRNGLIYVGWNVPYINKGNYFYGFSHTPLYKLSLPKETFTISCFRDPVKRIISHYNMLMDFRENNIDHPCMTIEGKWLGENFDNFLDRIPKEHLLNQLYMFSDTYKISEAARKVRDLSYYFFSANFDKGVFAINNKTGLSLESIHIRKASYHAQISGNSLARLRDMLNHEYKFLDRIRESQIA